jgi:hypothetical protein
MIGFIVGLHHAPAAVTLDIDDTLDAVWPSQVKTKNEQRMNGALTTADLQVFSTVLMRDLGVFFTMPMLDGTV